MDGKSLGELGSGDILRDLEDTLRQMSSGLADATALADADGENRDADWARRVVEAAAEDLRKRYEQPDANDEPATNKRPSPVLTAEVIQALANALAGPSGSKFEFPSSSDPRKKYTVTVMGSDMDCTCPGFEYRGTCKHIVEVRSKGGRK